ncbi:MAG: hypothetical protein WBA85_19240 [Brucella anthropi]
MFIKAEPFIQDTFFWNVPESAKRDPSFEPAAIFEDRISKSRHVLAISLILTFWKPDYLGFGLLRLRPGGILIRHIDTFSAGCACQCALVVFVYRVLSTIKRRCVRRDDDNGFLFVFSAFITDAKLPGKICIFPPSVRCVAKRPSAARSQAQEYDFPANAAACDNDKSFLLELVMEVP